MFRVEENCQFRGQATFLDIKLNNGAVENDHVAAGAGIAASKQEHGHRIVHAQESASPAADETIPVHVVHGTTGTLKAIKAGAVVAATGDATCTIDLLKNGVSILTGKISIDSGDAAYALVAGVIDTAALAVGDVLEIEVDGTIGTGALAKGVFAYVDLEEDYD